MGKRLIRDGLTKVWSIAGTEGRYLHACGQQVFTAIREALPRGWRIDESTWHHDADQGDATVKIVRVNRALGR